MELLKKARQFIKPARIRHYLSTPEGEIVILFVAWRLALYLVALASGVITDQLAGFEQPHPLASAGNLLFRSWQHWDAEWYMSIAHDGYFYRGTAEQSSVAFFPLFPLLMRALAHLVPFLNKRDGLIVAGMLIANLSFVLDLVLIHRLTRRVFAGHPQRDLIAKGAALSLLLFPTSVFFAAPYSESVYLLAVLLCFYGVERDNWLLAGISGAAAAAGRLNGVTLVLPLAIEFVRRWRKHGVRLRDGLYLAIVPSGLLGYMLYLLIRFGDPLAFLRAMSAPHWRRIPRAPWLSYLEDLRLLINQPNNVWAVVHVLCATAFIALVALSLRVLPPGYAAYGVIGLLLPFSTNLVSIQRYVLVVFPAFVVLGYLSRHRPIRALLPLLGILQGVSVVFWVNGFWVG